MKPVLLTLLFVCGVALGQQRDYLEYADYDSLPLLDDSLFERSDEPQALARASLEERQEQPFIQENNRPPRNPVVDAAPKYQNSNVRNKEKESGGYQPGNVKLSEPVDIPSYLDLEYEYEYDDIPLRKQESELHKSTLARSPIQEGPVYQIPPLYKPQIRPINKPDRGSYNPENQNIIYDADLTEEEIQALEEEQNKPDKLSLLLRETKFDCLDKNDGYYADDSLNCEVFHYCQDRVRHSWICPEYQVFDQVHLICMPQTDETACKDSSSFYFVNEYLHQPIVDESNITIGYGKRYYPPGYGDEIENEEPDYYNERPYRVKQKPPPLRPNEYYGSPSELKEEIPQSSYGPILPAPPRYRQPSPFGSAANQKPAYANPPPSDQDVFFSSEQVNIPLSQRRAHDFQLPKDMKRQEFEDFIDIEEVLQQKSEQES